MIGWIKVVSVALFVVLAPVHSVMATALALMVIDLFLGVWAANKRGDVITSAGLRRTLTKLVVYELGVVVAFLGEHFLLSDEVPLVKLAGAAIAMVELKSIVENLNEINGSPIFSALISALGSKNDTDSTP